MLPLLRSYRKLRAQAKRLPGALASHDFALALMPISAEQRLMLRRNNAARLAAQQVLAADPNNPAAWEDLGDANFRFQRHAAAIACYSRALAIAPENPNVWGKRSAAIRACGKQARPFNFDAERTTAPEDADSWGRRAASLAASKRFVEAVAAADCALAINSRHMVAKRVGLRCRIVSCDWGRRDEDERCVAEDLRHGLDITTPSGNRAISDSEAQNLLAARLWIKRFTRPAEALWRNERYRHDRIRLAYLSSEFHDHPVGRQIVGVFEHQNRAQFDTIAISLGGPNASAERHRIQAACDRFVSVHDMNDEQIAAMIREMEIDIAIDLDKLAARADRESLPDGQLPCKSATLGTLERQVHRSSTISSQIEH